MERQLTREEAISFCESGMWKTWTKEDIGRFQLFQDRICFPPRVAHAGIEAALGRPVWTHEFAQMERLREEYLTMRPAPTMQEILDLIPPEKRIIVFSGREED